jgi:hypothetical protein
MAGIMASLALLSEFTELVIEIGPLRAVVHSAASAQNGSLC